MRILIAVLAIVGIAVVTHARPTRRPLPTLNGFLEAMGDSHLFDQPPAENRSLADFEANADLVIWDAILQAENLYSFLN
uniref:Neuropeptide-Like Protein n=1 Tax=Panagrellus redivivus TaxID=6233 RepID=A0A7E4W4T0_PANRE